MKTVGVLLAGGLSRRFGSPKEFAKWKNHYFYEYAVMALQAHCDEILIVTRPELVARFPKELQVVTDVAAFQGLGPLAGIYTAMEVSAAERYIVIPCDMPHLGPDEYHRLLQHNWEDVVAVQWRGTYHPLVSIWQSTVKEKLKRALQERQLSVMQFLMNVKTTWIDGETITNDAEIVFSNINRPLDLERSESNECNG